MRLTASFSNVGSVPLNCRIVRRMTSQPWPRRSMSLRTTMALAIISLRDLGAPPPVARSTVMWLDRAPGLVTTIRSEKTSSRTCEPVMA